MSEEILERAKRFVHNQFGEKFAEKATSDFCLSLLRTSKSNSRFTSEIVSTATSAADVIMEFKEAPIKEQITNNKTEITLKKVKDFIASLKKEEGMKMPLQEVWGRIKMKSFREEVLKNMQPLKASLERSIERAFAHGNRSLQQQAFLTKTCWLNQTVRTIAEPKCLAEVASDDKIHKLDVPRKLVRELHNTGNLLFAPQFRRKTSYTGKGIIVAVIDSEVALNHKAFGNRVIHRSNYTKEPWGNPDSHGTAVAGIIGSQDNTYIGMAPDASIYNYKVLATDQLFDADDFQASLAIQQALEDGAHLANCSWGAGLATDGSSREARACNTAWDLGLTIVKSAGNRGPGMQTLTTPADARGVIVVGATGTDGRTVEDYSSRGPLTSGENRPHLLAPGGSRIQGVFSCLTAGGFDDVGFGTSYAAPHVTGMLALLLDENETLTPDEQRDFLISLCNELDGFQAYEQGAGIISMESLI